MNWPSCWIQDNGSSQTLGTSAKEDASSSRISSSQVATAQGPVEESAVVATSSIFGGAKPVNTAAREREIEERLRKEKLEKEKERQAAAAAAAVAEATASSPSLTNQDGSVNQSQNQ